MATKSRSSRPLQVDCEERNETIVADVSEEDDSASGGLRAWTQVQGRDQYSSVKRGRRGRHRVVGTGRRSRRNQDHPGHCRWIVKKETKRLWLTYPKKTIQRPVVYELGHKFKVVTNIRQSSVAEEVGIVSLELVGDRDEIKIIPAIAGGL